MRATLYLTFHGHEIIVTNFLGLAWLCNYKKKLSTVIINIRLLSGVLWASGGRGPECLSPPAHRPTIAKPLVITCDHAVLNEFLHLSSI